MQHQQMPRKLKQTKAARAARRRYRAKKKKRRNTKGGAGLFSKGPGTSATDIMGGLLTLGLGPLAVWLAKRGK